MATLLMKSGDRRVGGWTGTSRRWEWIGEEAIATGVGDPIHPSQVIPTIMERSGPPAEFFTGKACGGVLWRAMNT